MGRSSEAKNLKNPEKVKCDQRMDQRTDQWTDGPTKRGVESRSTRQKTHIMVSVVLFKLDKMLLFLTCDKKINMDFGIVIVIILASSLSIQYHFSSL